jgi:nickel-dependent lactate racemase
MTLHVAWGSPTTVLSEADLREALVGVFRSLGERRRVLAVPPDFTRANSRAGLLTRIAYDHYGPALADVLPALGTHAPMSEAQRSKMFPGVPAGLFRVHDWRNEVVTVGSVPADFVTRATGGIYQRPWPVQMNRLVREGGHDLILSLGQVVPHEVVGMANHSKNIFVGTGGSLGINESHFIGAAYGMERMMGRADTPVRRIFNEGLRRFCGGMPLLWVLTVVGAPGPGEHPDADGLVTRGLFIGDGLECFTRAAELSLTVNFALLDEAPTKMVVHLDPEEFHSTWLGNKSIYRTRMAIADGGELVVLAPGLTTFGEDRQIDALIRAYGYRRSAEVMALLPDHPDLRANLSAAAHLIHGSPEGRFRVTYCPGPGLTRAEIEGVGYAWGDLTAMRRRYDPATLTTGWHTAADGERFYYIQNPALGLWAWRGRFGQA